MQSYRVSCRGAVASVTFDDFHRHSVQVIKDAVFEGDTTELIFTSNNLVLTNVDIQAVEPVDQKTRDSLAKSVQLAIEITTKSQEASARHDSARVEQQNMGILERQKIVDQANAEKARKSLIKLQTESASIETTGQAVAEARAKAEAMFIHGESQLKQSQLSADAAQIKAQAELETLKKQNDAIVEHQKALIELEIKKARELAEIEASKFKQVVQAIGSDTIKSMAESGPAAQAKLLKGLGLQSFLITDGNSPINLFNTASGLLGGSGSK